MRHTFAFRIKEDKKAGFRQALGRACPAIVSELKKLYAYNYSLWEAGNLCFGYYETPSEGEETDEKAVREAEARCSALGTAEEKNAWSRIERGNAEKTEPLMEALACFSDMVDWIAEPDQGMQLMYHDIGFVRREKTMIRHRVFMTKLKDNLQTEYKRRHDGLVKARGNHRDPGPDSNFTIWNAGQYIFGYDEIDTSMERPETPEEHEKTIAWESEMLNIMDWITDDVDWLSGEKHPHVVRLMQWN
ncbi:MAG: L-rhamnose mutarotase [Oribacterium sp.]|nr:L-rhamnose mutarotase [Oribacterium sp.]